jgi:ketosteroid isomerase-like protein
VPQRAGARITSDPAIQSPEETVRLAYRAFATRDHERLRAFCHSTLELRPVDALGLVGDTLSGFDAACDWVREHSELGYHVTVWLRTLERVAGDSVLGVGVVAERGRGCAATVAWVWHVRDGLIDSVCGYPSEAAARRDLSCHCWPHA